MFLYIDVTNKLIIIMKTIKTIFKAILLIAILSLTSCSSDDDDDPVATARTNTFTIGDYEDFSSSNVYLVIDGSGSTYESEYQFIFGDTPVRLDASNDLSIQTSATGIIALTGGNSATTLASMQDVVNQITVGFHTMGDGSVSFNNILSWGNTYMYNATQYGTPDVADMYITDAASITSVEIESITFNLAAGTGTINCIYSYDNSFFGEYSGTFEILNRP